MKKLSTTITFVFVMLILISVNQACDKNRGIDTATVSIEITDKPFPREYVESAIIEISKIDIKLKNSKNNPYIRISEEVHAMDLLELTNGITRNLTVAEISTGVYESLTVFISAASVVMKDGRIFDLQVPGDAQTGLKIPFDQDFSFEKEKTIEILLDFDVNKSFIPKGNINTPAGIKGFNFKPVIKANDKSTNGDLSGTVTDVYSVVVPDVTITLYLNDIEYTTTFTDDYGNYKFIGLDPDKYELTAEKTEYSITSIKNVHIKKNKVEILDIQILPE